MCVEVRGHLVEVNSPLPLCGFQRLTQRLVASGFTCGVILPDQILVLCSNIKIHFTAQHSVKDTNIYFIQQSYFTLIVCDTDFEKYCCDIVLNHLDGNH